MNQIERPKGVIFEATETGVKITRDRNNGQAPWVMIYPWEVWEEIVEYLAAGKPVPLNANLDDVLDPDG